MRRSSKTQWHPWRVPNLAANTAGLTWRCLGVAKNRRCQERQTIPSETSLAPQTLRRAGGGGRACQWRTHSCVPRRHSQQTSRQAIGNPAMPKSVVGQDFILRPIFNRPSRSRFPQWVLAPETFPPGIVPRSWRRLGILASPRQRHECRWGTQECLRHFRSRLFATVCGELRGEWRRGKQEFVLE